VVDTDREFSLFVSVGLLKLRRDVVVPDYLRVFLDSPTASAAFDRIKVGGATHTNKLNLADLKTLAVPLPSLGEQQGIVAKVNELMDVCDQLEASLASTRDGKSRLLETLMLEAIEGVAVPELRGADER
jgi:type I restriction enzyme S subunit